MYFSEYVRVQEPAPVWLQVRVSRVFGIFKSINIYVHGLAKAGVSIICCLALILVFLCLCAVIAEEVSGSSADSAHRYFSIFAGSNSGTPRLYLFWLLSIPIWLYQCFLRMC